MLIRCLIALLSLAAALRAEPTAPIKVKVVILAMFEVGDDTGDKPGEFQFWVEREKLDRVIPLPAAYHPVRANADGSVIGIVTGMGNIRAAATVMALGLDPRFDFSQAYWLVAGISGADPHDVSVGSAVWADWVVDGDLGHEIDAREKPAEWSTGYFPFMRKAPYEQPRKEQNIGEAYQLDPGLVDWAYALTKDTSLEDSAGLKEKRALYAGLPNAQTPPRVLKGATLSALTFWHGALLNEWANRWVAYHSEGRANYMTSAMEDTGTLQALTWLARAGKADVRRALVLRTASNYDMQWPGATAEQSINGEDHAAYSGYMPSLEAAHKVGSQVVHALLKDWDRYATELPKP